MWITLYSWSTRLMTSELIQFGQCTSQNEADTKEVNWTEPGLRSWTTLIGACSCFCKSTAWDGSGTTSACGKLCLLQLCWTWLLLSTTVMGVLSVTSSQNALERLPDIEHTSLKDISISVSKSSWFSAGLGGKTPMLELVACFLFGFTVASLAPKRLEWNLD